jgi:eukaryotic-like serine/threonine-protein kinase
MGGVYDFTSAEYTMVVAMLVPGAPTAEREVVFADPMDARNVIPLLDRGETGDYRVIAMRSGQIAASTWKKRWAA